MQEYIMSNIFAFLILYLATEIILVDSLLDTAGKLDKYLQEAIPNARNFKNQVTEQVMEEVFDKSKDILKRRRDLELKLAENGQVKNKNRRKPNPSLIRNRKSDTIAQARESVQLSFDVASHQLYKKFNLSRDEITYILPTIPMTGQLSKTNRDNCEQVTTTGDCNADSVYRTANGVCNNLQNPTWGSSVACQQRLLPAYYEGNSGLRVSLNGEPLPAPRTLSLNLHYNHNRPTSYLTHMYMFFGQLLDHDLTLTPQSRTVDNEVIECCPPEDETHAQCEPVLISDNDPFYSQFGVTCLNFYRSAICPTCTMGPRQQQNQASAFIDASFVYGNSDNETNSLRTNDGTGRLRTQRSNYGDLLPASRNPQEDQCSRPETNEICFQAGDPRTNQNTVLASLQTIFVREHNRMVTQLRQINPHWGVERLFQETRRILGAVMQIITYKEYLPITLGNDRMSHFRLWVGNATCYDPGENPTMINEFTSAAFRFGHSLINSVMANTPRNATDGLRLLRNEYFQPFDLYKGYAGPLLRGASESPAQWFDRHLVPDLTNFLNRARGAATGLDLAAFNINRGRDHGIPPYVEMVRFCSEGEIVIRSFGDLVSHQLMEYEEADALQRNYRFVEDVDLWPGILVETPNDGAVVGPTGACIIGLQFQKLKYGDRFYVEHVDQAGTFTYQQLKQLRRMTLSQIMCLNTEVSHLPMNAMIFNSKTNPLINCNHVKGIDLSNWKE